jgi:aryl-alcohol dehydrogenase-like predicted oxidoreductase
MGMSGTYGPADEAESIATIHAAIDAGVTFLDTGDFYGHGHNKMFLREALKGGRRSQVFLSVKFGGLWSPDRVPLGYDARPMAVKNFLAYSLKRLGTDYIDLYQPSRLDPVVPIEETVGAIAEMIKAGYVRHVGLSEMSAETIRRAHRVHPIAALQIGYSIMSRGIEAEVLPTVRALGIALVAYGVLSRGLLSDNIYGFNGPRGPTDIRVRMPRFEAANLKRNRALVDALRKPAKEKGASVAQLAFAWVRAQGEDIVPLIGARRREQLKEALAALALELTPGDLERIEQAVPSGAVAGERYAPQLMKFLDSERAVNEGR